MKVFGNFVLIKPHDDQETTSEFGIVLLKEQTNLFHGDVVAVGRGDFTISGQLIKPECEVGDHVLFVKSGSHTVTDKGQTYILLPATNVLARVE